MVGVVTKLEVVDELVVGVVTKLKVVGKCVVCTHSCPEESAGGNLEFPEASLATHNALHWVFNAPSKEHQLPILMQSIFLEKVMK